MLFRSPAQLDLVLLEAGQVDLDLVAVVVLADIGLHHVGGVLAVELPLGVVQTGWTCPFPERIRRRT